MKRKNACSHSLSTPSSPPILSQTLSALSSPPMHSRTLSSPSSSPIRSHPPSAPSSPSILVDTSTKSVIGAKAGAKRKSNKKMKHKNACSHSLSAPSSPPILSQTLSAQSSPPMHSLTLSSLSSSPIRSHPPSAPSSPSMLVGTSSNYKSLITPCIGHRGYVNVPEESFTPVDIFKHVTVTSKRMRKAKQPVDL